MTWIKKVLGTHLVKALQDLVQGSLKHTQKK